MRLSCRNAGGADPHGNLLNSTRTKSSSSDEWKLFSQLTPSARDTPRGVWRESDNGSKANERSVTLRRDRPLEPTGRHWRRTCDACSNTLRCQTAQLGHVPITRPVCGPSASGDLPCLVMTSTIRSQSDRLRQGCRNSSVSFFLLPNLARSYIMSSALANIPHWEPGQIPRLAALRHHYPLIFLQLSATGPSEEQRAVNARSPHGWGRRTEWLAVA